MEILISDNFTIERLDDFQDEYVYDFENVEVLDDNKDFGVYEQ